MWVPHKLSDQLGGVPSSGELQQDIVFAKGSPEDSIKETTTGGNGRLREGGKALGPPALGH